MSDLQFVKYCPLCGAENPRQAAFCVSCADGDLTTVPVEPKRDARAAMAEPSVPDGEEDPETLKVGKRRDAAACALELVENPEIHFTVLDGQTVGRNHKADVALVGVPNLDYISGCHARLWRDGAQWLVTHLGSTNFIKVDGEMYKGQEEVPIYDGSVLVLSLTTFRVKIAGS
ncbi:MAG TPA: FHA domain-containing protein [Armatimonadota bacterium]|nr:FHA domain-containing protein [Armatimonadota bacterium]